MLRYKTETRPGLVALYDIRPGNGAGQFLQPRSLHGANEGVCVVWAALLSVRNSKETEGVHYVCLSSPGLLGTH